MSIGRRALFGAAVASLPCAAVLAWLTSHAIARSARHLLGDLSKGGVPYLLAVVLAGAVIGVGASAGDRPRVVGAAAFMAGMLAIPIGMAVTFIGAIGLLLLARVAHIDVAAMVDPCGMNQPGDALHLWLAETMLGFGPWAGAILTASLGVRGLRRRRRAR